MADNATLSFYATKDGKISVTIRAGTRARLCLRGKQFVLNWGPQRLAARIIDTHPRRFADDSTIRRRERAPSTTSKPASCHF